MLISAAIKIKHEGQDAQVSVLRNNGYCWGRLVLADGREFDIEPDDDFYGEDDDYVLGELQQLAANAGNLCLCAGAPIGWDERC